MKNLRRDDWTSEIETAGTVMPPNETLVDHFTVSPKLLNSLQSAHTSSRRLKHNVLHYLNNTPSHCFKFVVQKPVDYVEIDALVGEHGLSPVYIMPEGVNGSTLNATLVAIADGAIQRNYTLTTRLQILTYGQRRAV
jgi:organic radical activating enzyme